MLDFRPYPWVLPLLLADARANDTDDGTVTNDAVTSFTQGAVTLQSDRRMDVSTINVVLDIGFAASAGILNVEDVTVFPIWNGVPIAQASLTPSAIFGQGGNVPFGEWCGVISLPITLPIIGTGLQLKVLATVSGQTGSWHFKVWSAATAEGQSINGTPLQGSAIDLIGVVRSSHDPLD